MMGYRTPNIDRIANEGATFTDYYSQQSCTAGRACFITGQNPIRTGLTKVGMPGATVGLQAEDPTIAELLKPLGYATGQFGKNHLGDRDEFLPTVHGFDEFFGNLYHLNAEEEPELPDYPKDPAFKKKFGPRGVLHCLADGKGGQTIEDTGPLTKKRMETIDEEITDAALWPGWRSRPRRNSRSSSGTTRRPCISGPTSPKRTSARAGRIPTAIGWSCTTSRSARCSTSSMSWASPTTRSSCTPPTTAPRTTPGRTAPTRRSAARRTPTGKAAGACLLHALAGQDQGRLGLQRHRLAHRHVPDAAGRRRRSGRHQAALDGCTVGGKTFNVHLDGYNMIPYLTGEVKESPRNAIIYFSDDGEVIAVRVGDWKFNLAVQRANTMRQWAEPFVKLRLPHIYQPAPRPVRAGRLQLQHLLGLDGRSRPAAVPDAGGGGGADRGLRQVPAAPEAGFVQPGRGAGAGVESRRRHA